MKVARLTTTVVLLMITLRQTYGQGKLNEYVHEDVEEMFDSTNEALFSRIIRNNNHVLQHYLPPQNTVQFETTAT